MEEYQLKELAYTIFFGACGKRSNAEHVQVMRAHFEVSFRLPRHQNDMHDGHAKPGRAFRNRTSAKTTDCIINVDCFVWSYFAQQPASHTHLHLGNIALSDSAMQLLMRAL